MIRTVIDTGSVELEGGVFRDETINFAGADTLVAGTVLARSIATQKLIIYAKGGSTDGNGVPRAVLTYPITVAGAGDVRARVLIGGRVKKERLVLDADGNDSNIDGVVVDLLRAQGITPVNSQQLSTLDN
jgi:hypothetical protein